MCFQSHCPTISQKVKFQELARFTIGGEEDLKRQKLAQHLVDMSLQVVIRVSGPVRLKYRLQGAT